MASLIKHCKNRKGSSNQHMNGGRTSQTLVSHQNNSTNFTRFWTILDTNEIQILNFTSLYFYNMLKFQSNGQEELQSFLKLLCLSVIVLRCKDEGHNFNSRENKLEQQRLNIKIRSKNHIPNLKVLKVKLKQ
jgi:hypothetical protein